MKVVQFWLSHRAELTALIGQHVLLVAVSTLVAIAAGERTHSTSRSKTYCNMD